MKYRVTHKTEFVYKTQVSLCYNEARLLPRELRIRRSCPPPCRSTRHRMITTSVTTILAIARPIFP